MIITGELISGEFGNADIKSNIRIHCTSMHTIYNKGETIHCMYRNHDYFGDGSRYVEAAYFFEKSSVELLFFFFGDYLINILRKVNRLILHF